MISRRQDCAYRFGLGKQNPQHKVLREYKLENSINWEIAIVREIGQFQTNIETKDELNGLIKLSLELLMMKWFKI